MRIRGILLMPMGTKEILIRQIIANSVASFANANQICLTSKTIQVFKLGTTGQSQKRRDLLGGIVEIREKGPLKQRQPQQLIRRLLFASKLTQMEIQPPALANQPGKLMDGPPDWANILLNINESLKLEVTQAVEPLANQQLINALPIICDIEFTTWS